MMWKDQIFAAGMQVEGLAQIFHGHRRALDMPSRAPRTDLRLPKCFARLGRLPQREVARLFFVESVGVNARTVFDGGQIFFRKLAILRKLGDAEVIGAIVGAISEATL